MASFPRPRPLVVVILDGWGISFVEKGNAIMQAETPYMDIFARHFPSAALSAASIEVGLPWGEIGNSETGHRNIGAGQVQYQILPKIDQAIKDGSFAQNEALLGAINHAKQQHSQLHLAGLLGTGGVHAHSNHLFALLELAATHGLQEQVFIHLFTDGRDAPPQSALIYLTALEHMMGKYSTGRIASVTGRFYAMDRNENWERTKQTYDLLTGGPRGPGVSSATQAIERAYTKNLTDEMIEPTAITRGGGPIATIRANDAVILFNFRPDRARQLTRALTDQSFTGFTRTLPENVYVATLTEYDSTLSAHAAFREEPLDLPLARVIADTKLTQLHIAETEKYAHVTYYLNGGHEQPFPGEDHVLIPSSSVKSFASEPRMAAGTITDHVLSAVTAQTYDVYFINYANADMVGHSGNLEATIAACAFIDTCLGQLYETVLPQGGAMIVTADHGNAEEKLHPQTGDVETDHTSNPVPFHFLYQPLARTTPRSDAEVASTLASPIGVLADVAPTILDILELKKPATMTGISLLSSLQ